MNEYEKMNIDHFKRIQASSHKTLYLKDKTINSKTKLNAVT